MGGLRISAALAGMLAAASGCQATCRDCGGYVERVAGDYRQLASCVAGQPIEVRREVRAGVSVGSNRARGAFGGPEVVLDDPAARQIVVDVARYTSVGFRLTFTGTGEDATEVRGRALGPDSIYFWPNQAAPLLARCSGRVLR